MCDSSVFINFLLEEPSLTSSCLRTNLKYVDESRAFQNELSRTENNEITDLISTINSKLHSSGSDRSKALSLLESFSSQCTVDVYNKNYAVWMQQCSRWNSHTIDVELRILRNMIEKNVSNPEVKKNIITYVLPRFVDRLANMDNIQKSSQTVVNTLRCLTSFIHGYSSSCGPHRGIFQKYVIYCLTEYKTNMPVIREAASCFVALCECGTKGQQSINFKEAWSSKFNSLVSTCHKLLDSLYSNINYAGLVAIPQTEEFLPEFVDSIEQPGTTPLKRYHRLTERFMVVAELLKAMLLCKYTTSKSFRPNDVLNLACRILTVTRTVLEKCVRTNDILALTAVVPQVHEQAFHIIEALITSGKRNLIPYGSLICKICLQSLKSTHSNEWPYGSQKPFQSLRCKVYSVLCSWMSVAGTCSSIEIFADEIIPIIVADIEFVKPSVKLTVTTKTNLKKGKSRKRNHLVTKMNMQSDSPVLVDQLANAKVCSAAHQTLQFLLRSASVLIKAEHHNYLHSVILLLMKDMFSSSSIVHYPLPYADGECRRHLFVTFLSLVHEPHPKSISPLNLAVLFFEMGALDENDEVASFCKSALCQLEGSIHPRCPTLYFSHENDSTSSKFTTSERFLAQVTAASEASVTESPIVITADISQTNEKESSAVAKSVKINKKVTFAQTAVPQKIHLGTQTEHIEERISSDEANILPTHVASKVTKTQDNLPSTSVTDSSQKCIARDVVEVEEEMSTKKGASTCTKMQEVSKEPCAKKNKLSLMNKADDEKVEAMLSDFVDTLK